MLTLGFERQAHMVRGRRVRECRFERRSMLPVSAACIVANAVRERLASHLRRAVSVRLTAPAVPTPGAWETILRNSRIHAVSGQLCDGAILVDERSARRLIGAVFGETIDERRALSSIETTVFQRAMLALVDSLTPVTGTIISHGERCSARSYLTFFELLVDVKDEVRLGIALAREPQAAVLPGITLEHLLDLQIELDVELGTGNMDAGALLRLAPGATVPLNTKVGSPGLLKLCGGVVAHGACGVVGERMAFQVSGNPQRT